MNSHVYVMEEVRVRRNHLAAYMDLINSTTGETTVGQFFRCFGVFGKTELTSRQGWPGTTHLWEFDSWTALAKYFEYDANKPGTTNPDEMAWWQATAEQRYGGHARVMLPATWCPTAAQLAAGGIKGDCYEQEVVRLRQGSAKEYLARAREAYVPVMERLGAGLVGAWYPVHVADDQAVVLWIYPSWRHWGAAKTAAAADPDLARWRRESRDMVMGYDQTPLFRDPSASVK